MSTANPTRRRYLRWLVLGLIAGFLAFAAVSAYFAVDLTRPARRDPGSFAEWLPASTETVEFAARDGLKLSGWFVPHPNASRAVVLLHGYSSSRRQMLARAKFFHDHGYAVLLYDARAHGRSSGSHVSVGWLETRDLLGALDFLRGRGLHQFGLLGESQGGATIALASAELRDVQWVVLESTYPTLRDAIDRRYREMIGIPGWLGGMLMVPFAEWRIGVRVDQIAPIDHVAEFRCPVFVLHGEQDRKTFPASAEAIFARTHEPKSLWIIPGAGHGDLYGFAKAEYEKRLLEFIAQANATTIAATPAPGSP